jgi:DNA-binding winged helix-turn-helix (wHTH) protein/Tol biopolymer transport system component
MALNHGKYMEKGGKTRKAAVIASSKPRRRIYAFDDFRLDADAGALRRGETEIELPSRAFDALVYLIERRDRVVGKDEIIASIWHDVVVTDDSLIHAVSVLRRELGDDRNDPKYIKTIPRRGYRFVCGVTVVEPKVETDIEAAQPAENVKLLWRGAAIAGIAGATLAFAVMLTNAPEQRAVDADAYAIRLSQPSPPGTLIVGAGVLSPDGRYLAFVARNDVSGGTVLWVRSLSSNELRPLNGTNGATLPFWAPDSRRIAFFADGKLLALDLAAAQPRTIAAVGLTPAGGSWSVGETILFADWTTGLHSVQASGEGEIETVAKLDQSTEDISLAWPQFLPDGRRFLYQRVSLDPARMGTHVGSLDGLDGYRLIETESPVVFAPPRHVLYVSKDMLIAEELDLRRIALTGRAIVVARGVSAPPPGADIMVSATGDLLAFQQGIKRQNLAWFDRTGTELHSLPMPTVLFNPRVSPDQSSLLATGSITSDPGLWLASLSREVYARLEADAIAPLWSPDGRQVAFTSRGGFDLIVRPVDESGANRQLATDTRVKILNDWSPDGAEIVYTTADEPSGLDLWAARLEDAVTRPVLATPFNELHARISPDGKWIAYSSDESGVLEVYVQRYPELGDKHRVSGAGGGGQPQWRSNQRELFYLSADRKIMSVDVRVSAGGATFDVPRELFRAPIAGDPISARDHYAVSADGARFLIDGSIRDGDDTSITVMVNWLLDASKQRRESANAYAPASRLR